MHTEKLAIATLHISGMNCAACSSRVETLLQALPSVAEATVNLATETASVQLKDTDELPALIASISDAGFGVEPLQQELSVKGMSCASCSGRVQDLLRQQPGVIDAHINLATATATVHYVDGLSTASQLAQAVSQAGYASTVKTQTTAISTRHEDEAAQLRGRLIIAFCLTLPVFLLAMGSHFIPAVQHWVSVTLGEQNNKLLQFVLTTAVMLGPGIGFYKKGFPALLQRNPDMNSLIALGTTAAWSVSTFATFLPQYMGHGAHAIYFESAAVIITLVLLGRYLEARAKGKTGAAITQLLKLQARTARRQNTNGEFEDCAIEDIRVGDVLSVRPGEQIPTDGEVVDGSSWVDESMLSGEPMAVEKMRGLSAAGGTLNGNGTLSIRATRVGADTLLAQIIKLVEQAQGTRLPVQNRVDSITRWFVPAVLIAALITVLIWALFGPSPVTEYALLAGVAVLIIACPCAMGLATPTSIMVGTGRAAALGVLFRKGDALQSLHQAKTVVFDKTGTLTMGKPTLANLASSKLPADEILRLVAAVEMKSEHPIAAALIAAAADQHLELPPAQNFEALPGYGLRAETDGQKLLVGTEKLMTLEGIDVTEFAAQVEDWRQRGQSTLHVAIDGELAAVLSVSDSLKPSTAMAIEALRSQGLNIALISGDNAGSCRAIAAELGIETVVAEVLPDGKAAALEQLRKDSGSLVFVGDGINDAPALASADVGIALGTGTDVAIESADVVLISGDLTGVVNAFEVSRRTLQNIQQNLFWAFGYNILLIPVAAGILYPINGTMFSPVFAAAAMALSSVFVLGNALRLRNIKSMIPHSAYSKTTP